MLSTAVPARLGYLASLPSASDTTLSVQLFIPVCPDGTVMLGEPYVDTTGQNYFNYGPLAKAYTYTPNAQIETETVGPDPLTQFSFRKTNTYNPNGTIAKETGWVKL